MDVTIPILVDGNNLLWRCMHTQGELTPNRTNLGATKTFINMIARFSKVAPKLLGGKQGLVTVAWDDEGERSIRKKDYPAYKATRPKGPLQTDASKQRKAIQKILAYLGIVQLSSNEWEADDVLGYLADYYSPSRVVCIISNDKDLFQLLKPNVAILRPVNGGGLDIVRYSDCQVEIGVTPDRVVEYKALAGDKSDNIPGAKGIGDKKALKILEYFPTALAACQSAGAIDEWPKELGESMRKSLASSHLDVAISRKLVEIHRDTDPEIMSGFLTRDFHKALELTGNLGILPLVEEALTTLWGT